jgi:hypothetical protein
VPQRHQKLAGECYHHDLADASFGATGAFDEPATERALRLVHLVGIDDSVAAAPANRVASATVAPQTGSRRKSAIGVNRAAVRSILST